MFPPQTISNTQYELHMPIVTLLGQGGKDKIYMMFKNQTTYWGEPYWGEP